MAMKQQVESSKARLGQGRPMGAIEMQATAAAPSRTDKIKTNQKSSKRIRKKFRDSKKRTTTTTTTTTTTKKEKASDRKDGEETRNEVENEYGIQKKKSNNFHFRSLRT